MLESIDRTHASSYSNSAGKVLRTIYIKNFILIDELHLDFTRGLTVLTGETGAKSILLVRLTQD